MENKSIKNAMLLLTIPYLLITIVVGYILFFLSSNNDNKNIENNVVKITKKAEIIQSFEDTIEVENKNLNSTILTGFFVDKNTIITANHGINDEKSIYEITDKFGNIYSGILVSKDFENDTAFLKIDKDFEYFTKFKYTSKVDIGEKVRSINFSGENQITKMGTIKDIENDKIYSSISFEEGDSGSPLLNEKNEVIGINIELALKSGMGITQKFAF